MLSACTASQSHQHQSARVSASSAQILRFSIVCLALPRPKHLETREHTADPSSSSRLDLPHHQKVASFQKQAICYKCQGKCHLECRHCNGTGILGPAGYNKKTTLPKEILGTRWTAMKETLGWTHFQVTQQRKSGAVTFLLLTASCDASAQLWVNRDALRDRGQWAAGWLQMRDIQERRQAAGGGSKPEATSSTGPQGQGAEQQAGASNSEDGSSDSGGSRISSSSSGSRSSSQRACRSCGGSGRIVCPECDASGIRLIEL